MQLEQAMFDFDNFWNTTYKLGNKIVFFPHRLTNAIALPRNTRKHGITELITIFFTQKCCIIVLPDFNQSESELDMGCFIGPNPTQSIQWIDLTHVQFRSESLLEYGNVATRTSYPRCCVTT